MGYDRQLAINSVAAGEGQADQALSRSGTAWEFRGPEQLPRKDLYVMNVAEAKKLMAAANVTLPMKIDIPSWNATVIGQKFVDEIVNYTTQWRNNGIADVKILEETFGQFAPRFVGTYDTIQWGPNVTSTLPNVGISFKDKYFSPPEGVKVPTLNVDYVNNPTLNTLVTKQLGEFDRKARIATLPPDGRAPLRGDGPHLRCHRHPDLHHGPLREERSDASRRLQRRLPRG